MKLLISKAFFLSHLLTQKLYLSVEIILHHITRNLTTRSSSFPIPTRPWYNFRLKITLQILPSFGINHHTIIIYIETLSGAVRLFVLTRRLKYCLWYTMLTDNLVECAVQSQIMKRIQFEHSLSGCSGSSRIDSSRIDLDMPGSWT